MQLAKFYTLITNDVSDYINLLVRIAHIICNHPTYTFTPPAVLKSTVLLHGPNKEEVR
jgi:putative NADPH-quinone reductase